MGVESHFQGVVKSPDLHSLQAWMVLAAVDIGGYQWVAKEDLKQRFALAPYIRMNEVEGIEVEELTTRIREDALAYVEENVLKVKLGQRNFELKNGDLYFGRFGEKSFITMCRDTVLAREKNGLSTERARHEGLGVVNIVKLLELTDPGQVVVLISPPDNNDENMANYSMVYIYQKQENGQIWFGAVRDEWRQIEDWQTFTENNSMWQEKWMRKNHLDFVALPFVAKNGMREVLSSLGVGSGKEIPEWIRRESEKSAGMMATYLKTGDYTMAQKVLDAFKVAVIAGREQADSCNQGYSVARMVVDRDYAWQVRTRFEMDGGREVMEAGGVCGNDSLMEQWESEMNPLDRYLRDNNAISGAMGLEEGKVERTLSKMECVKCPFCHKTVDAILTHDKIKCPECKAEVSRS